MEIKEKAKELVDRFVDLVPEIECFNYDETIRQPQRIPPYKKKDLRLSKQCALICVDEILKLCMSESDSYYWLSIKDEINKL